VNAGAPFYPSDSVSLPPDVISREIVDDPEAALVRFKLIAAANALRRVREATRRHGTLIHVMRNG
jgi:hypothetical protein